MNHKLDTDRQVYFYEQEFYVLSNFSAFQVNWNKVDHQTAEHLYHFLKFDYEVCTKDADRRTLSAREDNERLAWLRRQIYSARSAHDAYRTALNNRGMVRATWDEMKVGVMTDILRAKAGQHEYVRRKLLETGGRELIEDSWRDPFWGWGPGHDGQNMLGKLWMQIRDEMKE